MKSARIGIDALPPIAHPECFCGFLGVIPVAFLEKLGYGAAAD